MSGGEPYRDVFERRLRATPRAAPSRSAPLSGTRVCTPVRLLVVLCNLACVAVTIAFVCVLVIVPTPRTPSFGEVSAPHGVSEYGFGPDRVLMIFNLTAFVGTVAGEERGLVGATDIHPTVKRLAALTMYRRGDVLVDNVPIALDQKGGDRAQINLGFEIRQADDLEEDEKIAIVHDTDERYSDYFIRGCYLDPSCTRDLAPTVLDVTPQMRGDTVEVLFYDERRGYTYEGVYNLFPKLKRRFYQKSVPWTSTGKVGDSPCDDSLRALGIVFESERSRPDRGEYSDFEVEVQADVKYPKSDYWETVRTSCPMETYRTAKDYFTVPNMENTSVVPLNMMTFVRMYMAAQLMMQVDFAFDGVQQFYYKSPSELALSTGPPYDFDGPWDLCKDVHDTPDIVTCIGRRASPLWSALGASNEFVAHLGSPEGLSVLRRDYDALDALYARRIEQFHSGFFDRHDARWPVQGRTSDFLSHLIALGRTVRETRLTVLDELLYQRRVYERRFERMNATIPHATRISVRITWNPFVHAFATRFWWVLTFVPLTTAIAVIAMCVWGCRRRSRLQCC